MAFNMDKLSAFGNNFGKNIGNIGYVTLVAVVAD
jgi:hypothetical protein